MVKAKFYDIDYNITYVQKCRSTTRMKTFVFDTYLAGNVSTEDDSSVMASYDSVDGGTNYFVYDYTKKTNAKIYHYTQEEFIKVFNRKLGSSRTLYIVNSVHRACQAALIKYNKSNLSGGISFSHCLDDLCGYADPS